MADHNDLGIKGEQIAVDFLIQKGYHILNRNYRFKQLEIDIIAQDQEELVVVEVKTRQSDFLTDPQKLFSKSKQKGLIQAANAYIHQHEFDGECRFDVIIVIHNQKGIDLRHIEDAFYPSL
jgi:putative endonuclease